MKQKKQGKKGKGKAEDKDDKNSDLVEIINFCEHIRLNLGYFEGERFKKFMQKEYEGQNKFEKNMLMDELAKMYKKDMEILISQSYERISFGYETVNL